MIGAAPMGILIVEDEVLLAMDLEAIIEDNGHRVVGEAASLRDVQALGDNVDPQLAFVDMQLADGTNGLEVCRLIQQRWPAALIVFVTANISKIPPDFAGGHGAIAKPFSHSGIVNALNYLAEGVFDPPPSGQLPASLIPAPALYDRLTTH